MCPQKPPHSPPDTFSPPLQVPCYSYGQKLSKLAILRIACNYILSLARLADLDYSADHSNLSFSECVQRCTRTLQAEGRAKKRKVLSCHCCHRGSGLWGGQARQGKELGGHAAWAWDSKGMWVSLHAWNCGRDPAWVMKLLGLWVLALLGNSMKPFLILWASVLSFLHGPDECPIRSAWESPSAGLGKVT